MTSFLSGCKTTDVYVPVNTLCTSVPYPPHIGDKTRAFFRAEPETDELTNWILLVAKNRSDECSPKAGGPK